MWERELRDMHGNHITRKTKDKSITVFESGREQRIRIRKQNRKLNKSK